MNQGEDENDNRGLSDLWQKSRSGAWAGRGFHYQHLFTTLLIIRQWMGLAPAGNVIPEGLEDCVVELPQRDVWIQIKSKKDGAFKKTEVAKIFDGMNKKITGIGKLECTNIVVALEQPVADEPTSTIDSIFGPAAKNVVVCHEPQQEIVGSLTTHLEVAPIIAEGIANDIYKLVAEVSEANASLPFHLRKRITISDIENRIFERLEAEDPSAIQEALASGSILPVDFQKADKDPSFYQGVKVTPGHITAGLVFDRPKDVQDIISGIQRKRRVLLKGPSGSGKTALMWLVARQLNSANRLFQIATMSSVTDAESIVKFVRSRMPSDSLPLGLIFDDVGHASSDLWNVLSRELRGFPNVFFLGSIRSEDVDLITDLADVEQFDVELDATLAERIWTKLAQEEHTVWLHWQEPFEKSQSLMLEYVHILTQGDRLSDIITDQVRRREKEERFSELALVRGASVLLARGAEVDTKTLFDSLDLKPEQANAALQRLVDEHLIRESRPGVLGGLHMLRSCALLRATHDETVYQQKETLQQVLLSATNESLPNLIRILFGEEQHSESELLELFSISLQMRPILKSWISILTGLGLATLENRVAVLAEILAGRNVSKAQWSLASMFVDPSISIPEMEGFEGWQNIRAAALEFREAPTNDFRADFLALLPSDISAPKCDNPKQAAEFLSCFAPLGAQELDCIMPNIEFAEISKYKIEDIASFLSNAYLIDPTLAENFAEDLGGEQSLLDLFYSQTPWVVAPTIEEDGEHGRTVRSNWYHIDEDIERNVNDTIVSVCETLLAISPNSSAAACDGIGPNGQPIEVNGYTPWTKNIPRDNLPANSRVAWNVAFRQIFLARTATDTLTDYVNGMSALLARTEKILRSFSEKWILAKSISNSDAIAAEATEIIELSNALAFSSPVTPASSMLMPSDGATNDETLGALVTGILGNLIGRVAKLPSDTGAKATACFCGGLQKQAIEHQESKIWRVSASPPKDKLKAIAVRLEHLKYVLHEMAYDSAPDHIAKIVKSAKKASLGKAIQSAARRCSRFAESRLDDRIATLVTELENSGLRVSCYRRPNLTLDGVYWPSEEIAILVEISDMEEDFLALQDTIIIGEKILSADLRFSVAPVINRKIIGSLALQPSSEMALPDTDFVENWQTQIDVDFLKSTFSLPFEKAVNAGLQISSIIHCCDVSNLRTEEEASLSEAARSFRDNFEELLLMDNVEDVELATLFLSDLKDSLTDEVAKAESENPIDSPLCLHIQEMLKGKNVEWMNQLAAVRLMIKESECNSAIIND